MSVTAPNDPAGEKPAHGVAGKAARPAVGRALQPTQLALKDTRYVRSPNRQKAKHWHVASEDGRALCTGHDLLVDTLAAPETVPASLHCRRCAWKLAAGKGPGAFPRPLGSPPALPAPAAEARPALPRGRPAGWRMPTFAQLDGLTVEDFSYLRALMEDMEHVKAYRRFCINRNLDANGDPVVPHGLTLQAEERRLLEQIQQAAQASSDKALHRAAIVLGQPVPPKEESKPVGVAGCLDFDTWAETIALDFYSENELPDRYRDYLIDQGIDPAEPDGHDQHMARGELMAAKVRALNLLQTHFARAPATDAATSLWLAPAVRTALARVGVTTIGALKEFIEREGRHWYKRVPKLGPHRAGRLLAWIDSHSSTLGDLRRDGPQWMPSPALATQIQPLVAAPSVVELEYRPGSAVATPRKGLAQRSGIAPLELLRVPHELDGHDGLFRSHAPNAFDASNDREALFTWLNSFYAAGKQLTFERYRREVERFYIWCLLEARVPLSGVSLGHAQAYQAFLQDIPSRYINSRDRIPREHPNWRPWRGQPSVKTQNQTLTILAAFYNEWLRNGYVTQNPFGSVRKSTGDISLKLDTSRALNRDDLALVREALDSLPGLQSDNPREAALARRTRLIVHLAISTGMRREEIATATLDRLRNAIIDNRPDPNEWMLEVTGKGNKLRAIPISAAVLTMIREHHADAMALLKGDPARLKTFMTRPPLVAVLQAPVRSESRELTDSTELASDNAALGKTGIYKTLKTFFRATARPHIRELKREATRLERAAQRDVANSSPAVSLRLEEMDRVKTELARWERFAAFSTHWMRHTFAHQVLAATDKDLKLAQQLLGHESINTTSLYVANDDAGKVHGLRKFNPFGADFS